MFQRNELRVERRGRGLKRGKASGEAEGSESRIRESMAKDKEKMA